MPEDNKDKTPYEQLLDEIAELRKENADLRKEFKEIVDFNRALLARKSDDKSKTENKDSESLLKEFIEGE